MKPRYEQTFRVKVYTNRAMSKAEFDDLVYSTMVAWELVLNQMPDKLRWHFSEETSDAVHS